MSTGHGTPPTRPKPDAEGSTIVQRVRTSEQVISGPLAGSSLFRSLNETSERQAQVEAAVQQGAVDQQVTFEQLRHFQETMAQTFQALIQQQQVQQALGEKQAALEGALSAQLEEHKAAIIHTIGATTHQGERLDHMVSTLEQRDRARSQARWGYFGRDEDVAMGGSPASGDGDKARLMVATASNMPNAPLYKGTSQRDKRAFMDAYLVYERKVRILNQSTGTQVYLMPVRGCIDHKTSVRICKYELRKPEEDLTEDDWREYFLSAREPEKIDMGMVKSAMKTLKMRTHHADSKSRIIELTADFETILDSMDLEWFSEREPKASVRFLLNALEPRVFRETIRAELEMECNAKYKKSVPDFLDWISPQLKDLLRYEVELNKLEGRQASRSRSPVGSSAKQNQRPDTRAKEGSRSEGSLPTKKAGGGPSGESKSRGGGCFKCGSTDHGVYSCPDATRDEAKALWDQRKKQSKPVVAVMGRDASSTDERVLLNAVANGGVSVKVLTDYGATESVVSPVLVARLQAADPSLQVQTLAKPIEVLSFSGGRVLIRREVKLELCFQTPGGPLILRNILCWITDQALPDGVGDILLSRGVMQQLGYSPQRLINEARHKSPVFDLDDPWSVHNLTDHISQGFWQIPLSLDSVDGFQDTTPVVASSSQRDPESHDTAFDKAVEETKWAEDEELVCFPELSNEDPSDQEKEVLTMLKAKVSEARKQGLSDDGATSLWKLLYKFADCFRLHLGRDPPVDMPPLEVRLKPDATPVRCKSRRYPLEQRTFMHKHVEELRAAGMIYRNLKSAWCSPPLVVKKQEAGALRMTVDVRAVNAQTVRLVWPMPVLEVVMGHLLGASLFFSLDFFKGYWQFLLAPSSQELFSFLTDEGVFTPTRVLMGGSDSVAYCQSTVQDMFADVLYKGLLVWLDDLLGYEKSEAGLLKLLERVLQRCAEKGLKLNPKKCSFYQTEALWCGKVVSANGIQHDPARITALQELPPPITGADLLQFVCAINWMRQSIPALNTMVEPLRAALERVYDAASGRTKRKAASVLLVDIGWGDVEIKALAQVKEALCSVVALAHPDPSQTLCVFADASENHWGAVVTQIPSDQRNHLLEEQDHQPLMFLSGTFTGAAKKWAIVEKEAFSLVETCKRADYLLHGNSGFLLFTDHRNLRCIFDPHSVKAVVPKYTADKLQRWALLLMGYNYTIFDIAGDVNVWADLLSRWGSTRKTICAIHLADIPLSPMLDEAFDWPSRATILAAQADAMTNGRNPPHGYRDDGQGLQLDQGGAAWIPATATQLQVRLLIVAHFGVAGHRGATTTLKLLESWVSWDNMKSDVTRFVKRCLHCASATTAIVSRPLGIALHATKPNELIHWDFLHMGTSETDATYVLVIKDDASHFVWLTACAAADAVTTLDCLLQWFATFGVCDSWVSDQGTHFKNEVIENLQHALGAHHHFTTARCPWANGTVEVVNRDLLQCVRKLLSEWRLPTTAWPRLLPIIQMVLNQSPSPTLGGVPPLTAMTGLKPKSPMAAMVLPTSPVTSLPLHEIRALAATEVNTLRVSLHELHKQVAEDRASKQRAGRASANPAAAMAQFAVGDYVLYADVWAHATNKLSMQWCGPAVVTGTTSNWVFTIRNMVTNDEREVHASRLKFYADSSLAVTGELLAHVAHNSEGHVVDQILEARYHQAKKRHELKIRWRGMAAAEDSWEPATTIYVDVKAAVHNFVAAHRDVDTVVKLAEALGIKDKAKPSRAKPTTKVGGSVVPRTGSGPRAVESRPTRQNPSTVPTPSVPTPSVPTPSVPTASVPAEAGPHGHPLRRSARLH